MFLRYPVLLKTHPEAFRMTGPAIAPAASRLAATLRLWRERARMRRELRHLDERLLADIGLATREAELESTKPFWRR